jgi:Flp pilus assembly protein TadD
LSRARLAALLTTAATAAALPSAASAAPSVYAFSDGVTTPAPLLLERTLPQRSAQLCTVRRQTARAPSLAASLKAAEKLAAKGAKKGAVKKLERSPQAMTAQKATALAAAAIGAGRESAALAALLRAHRLARRDPRPLVSAAVVMTNLGRPREALGLLAAAQKLKQPKRTPLAIPAKALIANNRGHALLGLGQWAAAEKELTKAAAQAPLLSEAKRNLAHAQTCQGKFAAAAKSLQRGARRQEPRDETTVRTKDEADQPRDEQLAPDLWLDLSKGVEPTLPSYDWPNDERDGKAKRDSLDALYRATQQRSIAISNQLGEATRAAGAESAPLSPLTRERINQLWRIQASSAYHPDILPLYLDHLAKSRAVRDLHTRYGSGQAGSTCGGFQEWRQALIAYDDATRRFLRADYRRMTAIAANAALPAQHAALMLRAKQTVAVFMSGVLQMGSYLAYNGWICSRDEVADISAGEDTTQTPDSLSCPAGLAGKAFKGKLTSALSISVECEKIGVEADAGGVLGVFGQVTHNGPRGETTIFIGPRVKVRTPGPLGPGATYKDGIYVTFGRDGSVSDWGARVEASVNFAAGDGSAQIKLDTMDFSMVGVTPLSGFTGQ